MILDETVILKFPRQIITFHISQPTSIWLIEMEEFNLVKSVNVQPDVYSIYKTFGSV